MNELIRHIEYLLLSHDCVIIPQFGGFVTHYTPAHWSEKDGIYFPPTKTIGFNSLLKLNDGLLAQSYMEAHDTDFSDANRKMEKDIRKLIRHLHEEGEVKLIGIGALSVDMDDTYKFTPDSKSFVCPDCYGLTEFQLNTLQVQAEQNIKDKEKVSQKNVYEIRINRTLVRNMVAAAVAIIAFFLLSTPVENTYIEADNYAMLFPAEITSTYTKPTKTTTTVIAQHTKTEEKKNPSSPIKPKAIRVEKVKAQPAAKVQPVIQPQPATQSQPATVQKTTKRHHIIIASVASQAEAEATIKKYTQEGYSGMEIIKGEGRIRICLASFAEKNEASKQLNQLRSTTSFKDAWILSK